MLSPLNLKASAPIEPLIAGRSNLAPFIGAPQFLDLRPSRAYACSPDQPLRLDSLPSRLAPNSSVSIRPLSPPLWVFCSSTTHPGVCRSMSNHIMSRNSRSRKSFLSFSSLLCLMSSNIFPRCSILGSLSCWAGKGSFRSWIICACAVGVGSVLWDILRLA